MLQSQKGREGKKICKLKEPMIQHWYTAMAHHHEEYINKKKQIILENVTAKIIDSNWMLELHQCLHFMFPDHFSRDIQIPCNLSQCSITSAVKPVSLSDNQAFLRLQRIKLQYTYTVNKLKG